MIDFHNHIIPNLDDGSKSIEMSLNMLREAESQGITDIINTVHYQHPKMEGKNTCFDFVVSEITKMQDIANKNNINIKIHPASEVFFQFNLTEILDNPITTLGNGKYMLIEFQRLSFPKNYEDELFKLQLKGVTPIIAHPERYRAVQNDIDVAKKWIDRGYVIQIDCASIIGGFGKETQNTAIQLLKNNLCHLIGSDAHNDKKRNFCLKQALVESERIIGSESVSIISKNSEYVLNGNDILACSSKNKNKSILNKFISFIRNN
tara:strand:+ start:262 stop:1050 length:789 start_codon:yes stop_codon:yes gene_type:complete